MTSKMISVREVVYKKLKKLKLSGESFSDLLDRLIKNQKKDPLKFFGIRNKLPKELLDEFEDAVLKLKTESTEEAFKRLRKLWRD